MVHRYMLDTNVLSDIIREPEGVVATRAERVGENTLCCSVVVACELRFGAAKRDSPRLHSLVEAALARLDVLPLSEPVDRVYAGLRNELERRGDPVGPNDLLIAAHALAEGLALVTDNVREFGLVDGLTLENWRRELPPGRG